MCGVMASQREMDTDQAFDRQIGSTKRGYRYADCRIRTGFAFDRHFCYAAGDREWSSGESRLMSRSKTIYFGSIDRRWKKEIERNRTGVVFVSPFLTSPTAERIIGYTMSGGSEGPKVYTCFTPDLFLSDASSLKTLKKLYNMGCELFQLDDLHAKVVITEGFASIGSQNLTAGGSWKNLEATVVLTDRREIALVRHEVNRWAEQATPITNQRLDNMDAALSRLRTRYTALADEMVLIDQEVQEAEAKRRDRCAQAKRRLKARCRAICKFHLKNLAEAGNVPLETAECLIRKSAQFIHPISKQLLEAPGHAKRIKSRSDGWYIEFGSNKLLISKSVQHCKEVIYGFLCNVDREEYETLLDLRDRLKRVIRGSVENVNGKVYPQYQAQGEAMVFGPAYIILDDFVNAIFELTKIDELENLLEEVRDLSK